MRRSRCSAGSPARAGRWTAIRSPRPSACAGGLPLAIQLTAGRIAQAGPPALDHLIDEWPHRSRVARWPGRGESRADRRLRPVVSRARTRRISGSCGASAPVRAPTHSSASAAALDGCRPAAAEQALGVLLDCHLLTQGRRRSVPAARPDPRLRGRRWPAETTGNRAEASAIGQAAATTTWTPPTRPTGSCTRSGGGPACRCGSRSAVPELATPEDGGHAGSTRSGATSCWPRPTRAGATGSGSAPISATCWRSSWTSGRTGTRRSRRTRWRCRRSRYLADPARTARASLALSVVSQQTGRHETAIPLAEEAAAICRSLADRSGEAESLDQIGLAHQRTARSREALAYFREARTLYDAAADPRGVAATLSHAGIASWHLGRYPEAHDHLREALALYREVGDRRGEAKALNNLGRVHLYNGEHAAGAGGLPEVPADLQGDRRTAERGHPLPGDRQRAPVPGQPRGGAVCLPAGAAPSTARSATCRTKPMRSTTSAPSIRAWRAMTRRSCTIRRPG